MIWKISRRLWYRLRLEVFEENTNLWKHEGQRPVESKYIADVWRVWALKKWKESCQCASHTYWSAGREQVSQWMDRANELFTHLHPWTRLISINRNFVTMVIYIFHICICRERLLITSIRPKSRCWVARYRDFQVTSVNFTAAF